MVDKLVAFSEVESDGFRSLSVMNFDAPVPISSGVCFEHDVEGHRYRTRHLGERPWAADAWIETPAFRTIDPQLLLDAADPSQLCTSANPGSGKTVELRAGTGLTGAGTRFETHRIVSSQGLRRALAALLRDDAMAKAALDELQAVRAWDATHGRSVYREAMVGELALNGSAVSDDAPDAWFALGLRPGR